MSAEEKIEIHRGLKGVYFERSATTFIDGKAGELRYRGYSIHDLATSSTFEETAYLLLHGELPTAADILRYAAALNPEATRKEFVEAAVACGYPPNSSANRFRESRNFDVKEYGYLLAKDGSLIITE